MSRIAKKECRGCGSSTFGICSDFHIYIGNWTLASRLRLPSVTLAPPCGGPNDLVSGPTLLL